MRSSRGLTNSFSFLFKYNFVNDISLPLNTKVEPNLSSIVYTQVRVQFLARVLVVKILILAHEKFDSL